MHQIRLRYGIDAPIDEVRRAFATVEGLASWWTSDIEGSAAVGDTMTFTFGSPEKSCGFEVLESTDDRVVWRGVDGPGEWVGTTVRYELHREGDETVLDFAHADWAEASEFSGHCTAKWGIFLLGAKAMLEGGDSVVYPNDAKISASDR